MPRQIQGHQSIGALSDRKIKGAKPRDSRYELADADGIFVAIEPNGKKVFRTRHQHKGKRRRTTIGEYPLISLSEARDVEELMPFCREHWPCIRECLLTGEYRPEAVRQVLISKAAGGKRILGVPTVLDRLIQQALLQVLQPIFDPNFSHNSHGFRPGRNAHDAVISAREHARAGHRWVVDVDLELFFDRVKLDVLMARVAARTRVRMLRRRGIGEDRAKASASNGRGPWWNAGASHMNQAFPKRYFQKAGLVSLVQAYSKRHVCSA